MSKICTVEGCGRDHACRGWCMTHYMRWRLSGDARPEMPVNVHYQNKVCSVEGCERKMVARGWCRMHYVRWRRLRPSSIPTRPEARAI